MSRLHQSLAALRSLAVLSSYSSHRPGFPQRRLGAVWLSRPKTVQGARRSRGGGLGSQSARGSRFSAERATRLTVGTGVVTETAHGRRRPGRGERCGTAGWSLPGCPYPHWCGWPRARRPGACRGIPDGARMSARSTAKDGSRSWRRGGESTGSCFARTKPASTSRRRATRNEKTAPSDGSPGRGGLRNAPPGFPKERYPCYLYGRFRPLFGPDQR